MLADLHMVLLSSCNLARWLAAGMEILLCPLWTAFVLLPYMAAHAKAAAPQGSPLLWHSTCCQRVLLLLK